MTDQRRRVTIVPHTHWDREWYEPFQTFRLKLVDLLDDLLDRLERDPSFTHFQLDGQMAVVDDYLAVRPAARDRLVALAASGRISMGPWYALPDEFLVSAETLVRNLQVGLRRAAEFGGAMRVGYLPDMFGHVGQLPQVLQQFGFEHAVVWRGVPSVITSTGFWWESPDGSRVRAEYLPDGYWNGQKTPSDPAKLVERIEGFEQRWGDLLRGDVLWMAGMDHEMPQPWLGSVVAEANTTQQRLQLEITALADHLRRAPVDELPTWRGELRSGARSNLLMGVTSNRVDVKQAAAAAERWLERVAEPAAALFGELDDWPAELLDIAWLEMIRNSAHDSSCACSADDVNAAVLVRYAEARHIAEGLAARAAESCAGRLADAGEVAVSTVATSRSGLLEIDLWGDNPWPGTQPLGERGGPRSSTAIPFDGAVDLLWHAGENAPELGAVSLVDGDDGVLDIRLHPGEPGPDQHSVAGAIETLRGRDVGESALARLTVVLPERQKVLALVHDVPGFGWQRWQPRSLDELGVEAVDVQGDGADGRDVLVVNGMVTVAVNPTTGTFALDGTAGMGRLVDDGDVGDTYNWCPPTHQRIIDQPRDITVEVLERGPLRARVAIRATHRWPAGSDGEHHRTGEVDVEITTTVEVRAASAAVRVTHEFDNRAEDHRLRAWFPLPLPATSSEAECAFGVATRGLAAEGGPSEKAMATFPMRRFVLAGGLTVITDGLLEYELTDLAGPSGADGVVDPCDPHSAANALALTVVRCTGRVSQGPMMTRPLPAGPTLRTPAAQLPGRRRYSYAVAANDDVERAYALADEVLTPMVHVRAPGGGDQPDEGRQFEITGAQVSAVFVDAGSLCARVFNPTDHSCVVEAPSREGWIMDLQGRPVERFAQRVTLGPWRLATLRFDPTR